MSTYAGSAASTSLAGAAERGGGSGARSEQERGFAFVAGEVRNQAQQSAGTAKKIKPLIDNSVSKVPASSKVDSAGETMAEIVGAGTARDRPSEIARPATGKAGASAK